MNDYLVSLLAIFNTAVGTFIVYQVCVVFKKIWDEYKDGWN